MRREPRLLADIVWAASPGVALEVSDLQRDIDGRLWYFVGLELRQDTFMHGWVLAEVVDELTQCPANP